MSFVSTRLQRFFQNFAPSGSLWRERDFMLLYCATTLVMLGSAVTQIALPLTAINLLHATATDMGVLAACYLLPFIILGLPAGVWIDRSRKRRLAMCFDIFAATGLAMIPLSYLMGWLCMPVLYVVAFMVSSTEAIGGSSMQVFITYLVGRDRLVSANSKLSVASSLSQVGGPALGAALVSLIGAPLAITVNAAGFLISAILVSRISRESIPSESHQAHWIGQIKEGLHLVWHTPILKSLVFVVCFWIMLNDSFRALYVLFASRDLHIGTGGIALINTLGALGALSGAVLSHKLEVRYGLRQTLIIGIGIASIGYMLYAFPQPDWHYSQWFTGFALFIMDCGTTVYVVNYLSLRQSATPDALLGRMVTTMRFMTIALAPIGTILLGKSGDVFGLSPTLFGIGLTCALLAMAAWKWMPSYPK